MIRFFRLCFCALAFLAFCSCSTHSGRVFEESKDPVTGQFVRREYSEYLEYDQIVSNGRLRFHLVVTRGKERVPKGWQFPPQLFVVDGQIASHHRAQGRIEEVWEIYLTNLSNSEIVVNPETIVNKFSPKVSIGPREMRIPPGQHKKTDPVVRVGIIYAAPGIYEFEFVARVDDKPETFSGIAKALTMQELDSKYGKK